MSSGIFDRQLCLSLALLSVLLMLIPQSSRAFIIDIDAHGEECFFDRVRSGTKITVTFEVTEGGFLDIDVKITGPDGKVIYNGERESNGRYTFAAHLDGEYKYCFSNRMSTVTPKEVMFSVDIAVPPELHPGEPGAAGAPPAAAGEQSHEKLEEKVNELSLSLTSVKHEQEYMEVRDRVHRSINESTNQRVVLWAFFEALLICVMSIGQVYYLKRFFEVRRMVWVIASARVARIALFASFRLLSAPFS